MINVDLNIQGLKQMETALVSLAEDIGAKKAAGMMTSALRVGAKDFQEDILSHATESDFVRIVKTRVGERVEIKPGFLKSRIKIKASTNGKGAETKRFGKNVVSVVKVGVFKVPYIVPYEYGTSKQAANPIIRNAFNSQTNKAIASSKSALIKKIKLARRRIAKQATK